MIGRSEPRRSRSDEKNSNVLLRTVVSVQMRLTCMRLTFIGNSTFEGSRVKVVVNPITVCMHEEQISF